MLTNTMGKVVIDPQLKVTLDDGEWLISLSLVARHEDPLGLWPTKAQVKRCAEWVNKYHKYHPYHPQRVIFVAAWASVHLS